jgi:hypothetical protein
MSDQHGGNLGAAIADEPLFRAYVDMIGRTKALEFQVRYCDEEEPVVWLACARYEGAWQAAAGMTPETAVERLAESLIDGGRCRHCERPTGITTDLEMEESVLPEGLICWYTYCPELHTFRRSCEGDT